MIGILLLSHFQSYPAFSFSLEGAFMADSFGNYPLTATDTQSETKQIYGALISVTILATIAVILRFVARRKSKAAYSYGTYFFFENVFHN